eukprot:gb/GECG01007576.1/.p1 GENE.gb/GECG01007576.1/~~gb/GECG01007576.1/.p1  ORF type:complete len:1604 (+),score=244.01 gb/GECG01007576.1/:1-4812(+)
MSGEGDEEGGGGPKTYKGPDVPYGGSIWFPQLTSGDQEATNTQWTLAMIKPDACGRPWQDNFMVPNEPEEGEEEEGGEEEEEGQGAQKEPFIEKPETRAPDKSREIVKRIETEGFKVVRQNFVSLSLDEAKRFYRQHEGKPFYQRLVNFMSSGQTWVMVLEKENAIEDFRTLMGPTDPEKAKEQDQEAHPLNDEHWSLRSLFGTDSTQNAVHGSDSAFSAAREIHYFFPESSRFQRTALLLSPSLTQEKESVGAIEEELQGEGYWIVAKKSVEFTQHSLGKLLDTKSTLQSEATLQCFTGGESTVFIVEKSDAIPDLFLKVGPSSVAEAKVGAPESLRSRYAESDDDVRLFAAARDETVEFIINSVFKGKLPVEHTLALIKPGTSDTYYRNIIREIKDAKFSILSEKRLKLTLEEAEEFYKEHQHRYFYPRLTSYMSSGDTVALLLSKPAAIQCWREMSGPTDPELARREAPRSMRARFGLDGTRNATHGSDSPATAYREIQFFFPEYGLFPVPEDQKAKEFIRNTSVGSRFVLGKGLVPDTLHTVVTRGLVELAKSKPSGIGAIRWLGRWFLDHNPKKGCSTGQMEDFDTAQETPVVEETAHEEEFAKAAPMESAGVEEVGETKEEEKQESVAEEKEVSVEPIVWRNHMTSKPVIVFVLGAPGAGKGTQCEKICEAFNYVHLSTGDLLREEINSGSELGQEIEATTKAGQLVSTNVVLALLRKAMLSSNCPRFLIDGFPRSDEQVSQFERMAGSPSFVLEFTASEEEIKERIQKRGEESGRADDNIESLEKRLQTFRDVSKNVIDIYRKLCLVRTVDSTNKDVEQVFRSAAQYFRPYLVSTLGGPCTGKSHVSVSLARELGYEYLDVEELVHRSPGPDESTDSVRSLVSTALSKGDIVPDEHVCQLIQGEIYERNPLGRFLLDNYPRTNSQREALASQLQDPDFILHLRRLPEKVMLRRKVNKEKNNLKRNGKRRASIRRKSISKGKSAPTKKNGSTKNGGTDSDDPSVRAAQRALSIYNQSTKPMMELFRSKGAVLELDARKSKEALCREAGAAFQPKIISVLGGPACGKSTQSARIASSYGYSHLSVGDLLRAEVARDTYQGKYIKSFVEKGQLVPTKTVLDVLMRALHNSHFRTFVIDGFPRAMDQVDEFESRVGVPSVVLYLDCSDDEMRERYNQKNPDMENFSREMEGFQQGTVAVIDHYARTGRVVNIDGTPDEDTVFKALKPYASPNIVFVLGGPGSGKGTQCAKLAEEMGYLHLSVGDIMHSEIALGTTVAREIKEIVESGDLAPAETTVQLVQRAITGSRSDRVLVDGFPRDMHELEAFERVASEPRAVLHLTCSDDVMKNRVLSKAKQLKRADDTEEAIDKRIQKYHEETIPVVDSLNSRGLLKEVSAETVPEEVYRGVRKAFQPELIVLLGASGSGRGTFSSIAGKKLGYHRLRVTYLLKEEAELGSDSPYSEDIKLSFETNRTAPLEATIYVINKAIQRCHAQRFILDGFPRVVSEGFPSAQDMVFALESEVGRIRGAVVLDLPFEERKTRLSGEQITRGVEKQLKDSVDTFNREKLPVTNFFAKLGKLCNIDASSTPEDVYEQAKPFIE